jgi:hypothetical protein
MERVAHNVMLNIQQLLLVDCTRGNNFVGWIVLVELTMAWNYQPISVLR